MLHFTIMFSVLNLQSFGNLDPHYLEREQLFEANANVNVCIANCMLQFVLSYSLFKYKRYFRLIVIYVF